MSARYVVEVAARHGQPDPRANALLGQLATLGIGGAKEIHVSALYAIEGGLTKSQTQQAAKDLLTDPITQEYRMDKSTPSQAFLVGPHWRVEVWPKPSVTDPVGASVAQALTDLGLPRPERVRAGAAYRVMGKLSRNQIDKMTAKLLANPLIHETSVSQE